MPNLASTSARRKLASATAAIALVIAALAGSGTARAAAPTFVTFVSPYANGGGEPTIGLDWASGNAMFQGESSTWRVSNFNDTTHSANWTTVTPGLALSLDSILFVDHHTNRTFVGYLYLACSQMSFSDNDGASWTTNPIGCAPGSMFDHETFGGGPLPSPLPPSLPPPVYAGAVYYCSDALVEAGCGTSLDGGVSFGPATPAYARGCQGTVGHIAVAPDGTVYVPHARCSTQQAVLVSTNAGLTWTTKRVPDSVWTNKGDPAVSVGAGGSVYFGYQQPQDDGGSIPIVQVSQDRGDTWSAQVNVGSSLGIKNVEFPTMIAGDDDKAAFAFLGSTTSGDDQSTSFGGSWHLYVSTTADRGVTWTTVDATPADPVQIGTICMGGIGCGGGRNLLDFIGMDIDATGRIFVAFADGCVGCTNKSTSNRSVPTIARQSAGPDLIAAR